MTKSLTPKKSEEVLETSFKDLPVSGKVKVVSIVLTKICCFLACLYVFICSLGLLESAFQLLGGKTAGKAFSSGVLSNPLAGLMIGVLATVLMQSSSTSTSIVVTMVGSKVLSVEKAVPIVMGANIGTSVTNTLVSLAQAGNRREFRRAFAGATVHDMFNWLAVIVLLPIELAVGYLAHLSQALVDAMGLNGNNNKTPDMLKALTKPLLESIVRVNKDIIEEVAHGNETDETVLKRWCKSETLLVNTTVHNEEMAGVNCTDALLGNTALSGPCINIINTGSLHPDNASIRFEWDTIVEELETHNLERCDHLFAQTDLDDVGAGVIILVVSLILMLAALMLIVKILNSMLNGSVTKAIKNTINADLPGKCAYFTGYLAIVVGCGLTIIVQSSSIFTSTLTPLVGLGIVNIDRMYPMTLGSNIGTTVTAVLAALSQSGDKLENSLRIALCHLFFNISGVLLFYPIPFMRVPIGMAKVLGKTTAKHRWFAIFYIILMFVIFPGFVFGLSYAGWVYLAAIGGPLFLIFLIIVIINAFQKKKPHRLPKLLRTWDFLPHWMHSLKPVDALIAKVFRCAYCQKLQKLSDGDDDDGDEDGDNDENYGDNVVNEENLGGRDNRTFVKDIDIIEKGEKTKTDENGYTSSTPISTETEGKVNGLQHTAASNGIDSDRVYIQSTM